MRNQNGQTLIETIVAIFILTTALTAGLALTIYVLSHSDQSFNEIIATNLAREGVEVVKNMRDTNWLESDAKNVPPWSLDENCTIGTAVFRCYPRTWEGVAGSGFHNYNLLTDGSYRLDFNSTTNSWSLSPNPLNYNLYKQDDGSYNYVLNGNLVFHRKIVISRDTNAPFSADAPYNLSELIVTSIVSWSGKSCSNLTGSPPDPSTTNCNVSVTERLTNWKDYR